MNAILNIIGMIKNTILGIHDYKKNGEITNMDFQNFLNTKSEVSKAIKRFCLDIIHESKIDIEDPELELIIIPKDNFTYGWRTKEAEGVFYFNYLNMNELYSYWTHFKNIELSKMEKYLRYYIEHNISHTIKAKKIIPTAPREPKKTFIVPMKSLTGAIEPLRLRSNVFNYVENGMQITK